ncbi:Formate dehydrogenase, mitochondrial [Capsicum baccatum]|uniref:Formate dehydrogenase, mitochondrial n=1 Tax=Capsicum baccatum TaxID=33114 RepID=A0A2G2VHC7_CAPBA|nr:Formate dehydrogenase, mitochondrial [Capsicum baccatum]
MVEDCQLEPWGERHLLLLTNLYFSLSSLAIAELEKYIPNLHVLISTPSHPAYVTAERIKKAKNLQLLLTAGIRSNHVNLKTTAASGLTIVEVTGINTISVVKDELMRILILIKKNFPGRHHVINGDWNVAGITHISYDLEGKTVGTVDTRCIGRILLQLLKPFNCNLLYNDRLKMDPELESQIEEKFEKNLDKML